MAPEFSPETTLPVPIEIAFLASAFAPVPIANALIAVVLPAVPASESLPNDKEFAVCAFAEFPKARASLL